MSRCWDIDIRMDYFNDSSDVKEVKKKKRKFEEEAKGVLERFDEIINNLDEEKNICYGIK